VPLKFLGRKTPPPAPEPAAPAPRRAGPLPEEAVAQEHLLRLTYAGKTSEGVRLKGGPEAMASLTHMLEGIAIGPVEVVDPLEPELGHASPVVVRAGEAAQWLRARGSLSPITRHALFVLETLDALDPAFDTFACSLLDGELDPAGYPEYASIVGGVAAHWDEGTGDLIVRGVVGWGGSGTRGDTDRTANRLLLAILGNILETSGSLGVTPLDRPGAGGFAGMTCAHCGFVTTGRALFCPKCGMKLPQG